MGKQTRASSRWSIRYPGATAAEAPGRLSRRPLRLRAGDLPLQFLTALGQFRGVGPQQERVDPAIVLDGADRAGRQAQPDGLAKGVGEQRGGLQIGQKPAPGLVVGMAYVVATQHALPGDLTASRHTRSALWSEEGGLMTARRPFVKDEAWNEP